MVVVVVVVEVYLSHLQVAPARVQPDDLTRRLKWIKYKAAAPHAFVADAWNVSESAQSSAGCSRTKRLTSAGERVRVGQWRAHASCAGVAAY